MPVEARAEPQAARMEQWKVCRDCNEGSTAIKAERDLYLPTLSGQTADHPDYRAMLDRALFYGAFPRAVEGLSGMIFRREPTREMPQRLEPILDDVTRNGRSMEELAEELIDDVLQTSYAGILVDRPATLAAAAPISVLMAQRVDNAPFAVLYRSEDILEARFARVHRRVQLQRVRLLEREPEPNEQDEFDEMTVERVRVLELDEQGLYRQRMFRKSGGQFLEIIGDGPDGITYPVEPRMNGQRMEFIPFRLFPQHRDAVLKPFLHDLAVVNISHYRTSADLEWGAHYTGLPTLKIIAANPPPIDEITIGGRAGIRIAEIGAEVDYLYYGGEGLAALENRLAVKEQYMAFLGARMLSRDRRMVEAAETAQIHRMGEFSVLASVANSCSRGLSEVCGWIRDWQGITGDAQFWLNSDFNTSALNPQMVGQLLAAWQGRGISYETFWRTLVEGEVIQSAASHEEEMQRIAEEALRMLEMAGPPPEQDEDEEDEPAQIEAV